MKKGLGLEYFGMDVAIVIWTFLEFGRDQIG
jgi:hypothetical protein